MSEDLSISRSKLDVTGQVNLEDPDAVSAEVCAILRKGFPGFDDPTLGLQTFLQQAFRDARNAYWGNFPGLEHCDTPYHDLRHALDTALLVARMVDGYQKTAKVADRRDVSAAEATLTVFLALFHDVGFIRRCDESVQHGAQLMSVHEERGVTFVHQYLGDRHGTFGWLQHEFADDEQLSHWAEFIMATKFAYSFENFNERYCDVRTDLARIIGSADLISQTADRCYLERCRDFLYPELVKASADRTTDADGQTILLFADPEDLLSKTPEFYRQSVLRRLSGIFQDIDRHLQAHFGGSNPFRESMDRNHDYLVKLLGEANLAGGLKRTPQPVIPVSG